jgi:hypothetical protein
METISFFNRVANLSPIKFINIDNSDDILTLSILNKNNIFIKNETIFSIAKCKIIDKIKRRVALKKRLSEIDITEKIVFKIYSYENSCFFSKYKKYVGEIILNQLSENNYFQLQILELHRYGKYSKDYEVIHTYISEF